MRETMAVRFYKRMALTMVLIMALVLTGCAGLPSATGPGSVEHSKAAAGSDLKVHFIDVGQGDSTLIEKDGHFMLIDAGERDQGQGVVSYLKKQGVGKLDYVIGTHPHSDHIGGLETVIKAFDVEKVIMPEKAHTTKQYERLLDAIEEKGLKITLPEPGTSYELGEASFQIIAPNGKYGNELNNWSVGIRLDYGKNSFVLCGDAEKKAESDMLANGLSLKADVLKLSHHGSSTSSSREFIQRVNPKYAIVSSGKNNDYGHPHKEVLELMKEKNIQVFRTDQLGTIVAVSDGTEITFPGIKGGAESSEEVPSETVPETGSEGKEGERVTQEQEYVINTKTHKFHRPSCSSVSSIKAENRSTFNGSREKLVEDGYDACKICKP